MEKNVDRYIDADQVITDRSDNRRTSVRFCLSLCASEGVSMPE